MDLNDMVGKIYGRLLVQEHIGTARHYAKKRSMYRCLCLCGNEVVVARQDLLCGKRTTCGNCFRIEVEEGGYRYYDRNNKSFIFDKVDLEMVKKHRWRVDSYGYPVTRINNRNYRLTRLILNPPKDLYVDHVNGNPQDNRRENLRVVKSAHNQMNMCIPKHNTSGYKGVSYSKEKSRYRAQISLNNKAKHIGYFDTPEEAARAYDKAARFYFGEYACVNFPSEGEQSCHRKGAV